MNSTKQLSGLLVLCLLLSGPVNLHAMDASSTAESRQDIEQLLRTDDLTVLGADILTQGLLLEACEDHDFAPYWTNPDRIRELMELINSAADHGLKPSDYHIDALDKVLKFRLADPSAEIEAETDILLTESLFVYAYHRHFGKAKANALDAIVETRETQRVNLRPKVPVIILYITASIDADGDIRFYKDIYDRDQKVLDALNGPVVIQLPTG
jgi:murein L,D-transpeptidase YcbB/YkuD